MICSHCNNNLPEGLAACYHCGKPLDEPVQQTHLTQEPIQQGQPGVKTKGLPGIIAAAVVVLLLGCAVGGHFMGLYSLPFIPEKTATGGSAPFQTGGSSPFQTGGSDPVQTGGSDPIQTGGSDPIQADGSDPGQPGEGALNRLGYNGLTIEFRWGDNEHNPDSLGMCWISANLAGDTSNVHGLWISGFGPMQWTNDHILNQVEHVIPLWKQQLDVASYPKMGSTFYQAFPIMEYSLGTTVNVLLLAFNENLDPAGHVIVPVTFPESQGNR